MYKVKNPRTAYIIFRLTPMERQTLLEEVMEQGIKDVSTLIRRKLGLNAD